ncbi:MAG: hypothetical protein IE909_03390 [Campylobacterales bacterium]|nr:hypothetical protein [Campylobacterales bacterium]
MQLQESKGIHQNYLQEDEIDLKELFGTIWKNKFKIAFFSFVVTSLTVAYTLSIPNSYTSSTTLVPQASAKPSLGGLGALAGMAGIDLGGGKEVDAATSLQTILDDQSFQYMMIEKYNLSEKLEYKKENLVFALGYTGLYDLLHKDGEKKEEKSQEETNYDTFKSLQEIVSISSDKKSGMITLSAVSEDRIFSKELVEIYLKELTTHLRKLEMQDVQKQIDYYKKELDETVDLSIKEQLSQLISGLVQKKVLSLANPLYNVKQFTKPQIAFVKDKTKPKRGLIVVVSFVTSIILGIFGVFFMNFLRGEEKLEELVQN